MQNYFIELCTVLHSVKPH